ncbi:MAG: hypothetical protein ACJAZR_001756 [Sediminicola sp.]|jgi:hypothetical protein
MNRIFFIYWILAIACLNSAQSISSSPDLSYSSTILEETMPRINPLISAFINRSTISPFVNLPSPSPSKKAKASSGVLK